MELVDVGSGLELAVHRWGTGRPLVVLHGFTGDAGSMSPLTARLAPHCSVVAVDLIGHGGSSRPDAIEPYSMEACVEQVHAVIETLGIGPSAVVGYSMGGRVALSLAVAHPDDVSRLALIGARAGVLDDDERAARIAADEALAARIIRDGLEAFVDAWMAQPLFATQQRLGEAALASAREQRLRNDPVALAYSLRGMGSGAMPPLQHRLAGLEIPVDVIVGADDDRFAPIAAELDTLLPMADLHRVEGAGHAAHLEQPDTVASILLADRAV